MANDFHASKVGYTEAHLSGSSGPREIGICTRVQGLINGMRELNGNLATVLARIDGTDTEDKKSRPIYQSGLVGSLDETEALMRECLSIISALDDRI